MDSRRWMSLLLVFAWVVGGAQGNVAAELLEPSSVQVIDSSIQPGSTDPAVDWLSGATAMTSAWETSTLSSTVQEATGRQFYVSKTGSDSQDGLEATPWASISHAVAQLQAGDTLYIQEGVYAEGAVFNTSGTADAWITIVGLGNVVIDGQSLVGSALASDPIRTVSPELVAELGTKSAYSSVYAFQTNGQDYLRFKNLTVNRMQAGVEVQSGSSFIEIDGLHTDGNRFAVRINNATDVTVRNSTALNSWNAFRAYGASSRLLFHNIEARGSKDIYSGMNLNYLNGDGFIFEATVSDVLLSHIVSADHWDAGFDVKAARVRIEHVTATGNKNNWKVWGPEVVIEDSLSYGARRQRRPDGSYVEGNGITLEVGAANVTLRNVTIAGNEWREIEMYDNSLITVEDSIVSHGAGTSAMVNRNAGTTMSSARVLWQGQSQPSDLTLGSTDNWTDPQFTDAAASNYHLATSSWAWGRDPSGGNLGAFELQATNGEEPGLVVIAPPPPPEPDPLPDPVDVPEEFTISAADSLQDAVSRLAKGDTLYLTEGVYNQTALFAASGTADAWIRVVGVGNVVLVGDRSEAGFDTGGQSWIRFENLTVNNMYAGIDVTAGSSNILITGLQATGNRYAVRVDGASEVTVRDAWVRSSTADAFRAQGDSHGLRYENVDVAGSSGNGFFIAPTVTDLVLRHVVSNDNRLSGMDIRASQVVMAYSIADGNRYNWRFREGTGIIVRNSLSSRADDYGVWLEDGAEVVMENVTVVDNADIDIRMARGTGLTLRDSVVARNITKGYIFRGESGISLTTARVNWYAHSSSSYGTGWRRGSTDWVGNPRFVSWSGDYRLTSSSWGWGRASSGGNLGAYEWTAAGSEQPGLTGPLF